jgi:predicted lipoprotein with Yx(FWY)xxD motif
MGLQVAALAIGGCGGERGQITPATVGLERDGNLGKVLVDSRGRTLYVFGRDSGGRSACAAECTTAWPPLRANGTPLAGPGLTGFGAAWFAMSGAGDVVSRAASKPGGGGTY